MMRRRVLAQSRLRLLLLKMRCRLLQVVPSEQEESLRCRSPVLAAGRVNLKVMLDRVTEILALEKECLVILPVPAVAALVQKAAVADREAAAVELAPQVDPVPAALVVVKLVIKALQVMPVVILVMLMAALSDLQMEVHPRNQKILKFRKPEKNRSPKKRSQHRLKI